jgi:hypothetical protein
MTSYSHSATYWFIELALEESAQRFVQLKSEMEDFVPRTRQAYVVEEKQELDRLIVLNPNSSESLQEFVKSQFDSKSSEKFQIQSQFGDRMASLAVSTVVLSHSLCEAVINAALAIGLLETCKKELFGILETANLKLKWTAGPKTFIEKYEFLKSNALYEKLHTLCKMRNVIVHSKITVRDENSDKIIEGSEEFKVRLDASGWREMEEFLQLPYILLRYLCDQVVDQSLKFRFECLLNREFKL